MTPAIRPLRYLAIMAASALASLAAVATLSIAVDPWGVFGTPVMRGLTELKTTAVHRPHWAKLFAFDRLQPATVILGSSIPNLAFDPASPDWRPEHRPVFNFGLNSANPDVQARYLAHVLVRSRPRRVILTLSAFDTRQAGGAGEIDVAPSDEPALLTGTASSDRFYRLGHLRDILFATVSLAVVKDDLRTVRHQSDGIPTHLRQDGFDIGGEHERGIAERGSRFRFDVATAAYGRRMLAWGPDQLAALAPVVDMIRAARAAGADVAIVIPPLHVDAVQIASALGRSDVEASWRRALLDQLGAALEAGHVSIWDFSGVGPEATEALPAADDRTSRPAFFFDAIHPRPILGNRIIRTIETGQATGGFGRRLDRGTPVGADPLEDARRIWAADHPAEVDHVAGLALKVRADLCKGAAPPDACARLEAFGKPEPAAFSDPPR